MGTDVQGYIEINTRKESGEDLWFSVIDIGIIAERNYEIFGKLFGVRSIPEMKVLAASRGIPEGTANSSALDPGEESVVSHSWAYWGELDSFLKNVNVDSETWGWPFLFSNMSELAERYGRENVRLVVAFDNYG